MVQNNIHLTECDDLQITSHLNVEAMPQLLQDLLRVAHTTERLRQASLKYQQLDHSSAEYQQLYRDWHEQRNVKGGCVSPRGLFIRREMARLKAEGNLAADPTKNLQDWSRAHAIPMCDAYN